MYTGQLLSAQSSQSSMHPYQRRCIANTNHIEDIVETNAVVAIGLKYDQVVELEVACCANSKPNEKA